MKIETRNIATVADLLAAIADADPTEAVEFTKGRKAATLNACWCGCGGETKSRFVPGHDSRFHGLAKRVARGEEARPTSFVCPEAEADFDKWHDAEAAKPPKAAKPKAKAAKPAEPKADDEPTEAPKATINSIEPVATDPAELEALLAEVTMAD